MSKNALRPASGNGGTNLLGSIGDIIYLGGVGGNGDGSTNVQAAGGGGGSGGTLSSGNNGSLTNGAIAVIGGGAGGNGKAGGTSGAGNPGGLPGGGGGGGNAAANNQKQLGGSGASGKVAITYTIPAPTYTWVATSGSNDWTAASSWLPIRTTPTNNDVLLFVNGGSSTATNVPTQTIGKLQVSVNTTVTLQPTNGVNTLTINEAAVDSLTVAGGSQLNVLGAAGLTNLTITVASGAKASITGSMTFFDNLANPNNFTLTAADPGGITFQSGATFTQNCPGNVFGSGTANSVVFAPGSSFVEIFGNNPFQKNQPTSVVVFQPGSLFSVQGNLQPSASGRTYADLEIDSPTFSQNLSGSAPLTVSNLSILQGTLSISMGGGFNLNGNALVASGATLYLNNNVTTASGKTLTINGTLGGTGTNSGSASTTISATGTLAPGTSGSSIGTLTFATAPTLNGTNYLKINRNGGTPLADKVALSAGTLAYGGTLVVTNIGAALQPGDIFTIFSAPSFNNWFSNIQLPAGYNWNTNNLLVNGTISLPNGAAPKIGSISISNPNIVLNATNGTPNGPITVLTSTNLALLFTQWLVATNGNFDGLGNFSCTITNGFNANSPQRFYLLQTP